MKTAFVRHLIVCAAALVLADAWADTWTDPDTGYTWTYRITKEALAEIYNDNSCAISPSPTGALEIPSSLDGKPVTSIGAYALYECNGLTSVAIPDSVTGVGRYAFTGCTNLTGVYITDLTAWCRIHFDQWGANPLEYAHNLYINGTLLEDLIIPDGVTSIECHAFNGGSCFTSVTIPSGVTNIDAYAFYECTGLRAVHTPSLIDWYKISFYGKYDNPLIYAHDLYVDVPIEEDMFPIAIDRGALWYMHNLYVDLYVDGSIVEDFVPVVVELNAAGGYVSVGHFIAYPGCQIDELPTPIQTGYNFLGWFTLAEGGERVSCGISCETNMTLFAHWEKEEYTIVFNSFVDGVEIAPRTRLYGEAIGELPVIEVDRYGYTFGGWENVNEGTIVTSNMTISAVWNRNVYAVSFDAHAEDEEIGNMEKFYEESFGGLPQPTWSGHVFLGWYTDELGGEEIKATDKVTSDVTLHAHWAEGPFEIEVGGAEWSYQTYSGVATIISATANEDSLSIPEMLNGAVVVEIPTACFAQVANLKCVAIPGSVTNIDAYAFYNCTNLEEVVFNEGLQKIESGAFAKCEKLRTVTLPTTLVSLGDRLAPARLTDVYDSQLFLYIDDFLVNGTNFVDEAAGYEFLCDSGGSFEETNTGDSETSTETHGTNETFWTTALFSGEGDGWTITCVCSNNYLSSTRFERNEQNVYLSTISASNSECAVFGVNNAMGVFEGCKALESVSLSFGLREIGAGTFKDCVSLGSLDIPDSVVSIGGHGEHVEQTMSNTRCSVFDKLQVEDLAPSLLSSEQSVSDDRNNRTYEGSGFVQGCISLTNIVLPSSLSYLGPYSFAGCTSLRDVDLPDLLRTVNEGTFSGCSALETVKLPESLDLIGGYEFTPRTSRVSLCDSLCQNGVRSVLTSDQEISIQYDEEGGVLCSDMLSQNGASCCVSCYLRTNITHNADGTFNIEEILIENDLTTNMTSYVAEYDDIDLDNRWQDGVETVFVPKRSQVVVDSDGCDRLGELMDFIGAKCSGLDGEVMTARRRFYPDAPVYNGKIFAPESGVFFGCRNLRAIVLPNTVRRIADYAFYNCSALETINVPDSLAVVGYRAFGGTTNLPEVGAPWLRYPGWIDDMVDDGHPYDEIADVFDVVRGMVYSVKADLSEEEKLYVARVAASSVIYALEQFCIADSGDPFDGIDNILAMTAEIFNAVGITDLDSNERSLLIDNVVYCVERLYRRISGSEVNGRTVDVSPINSFSGLGNAMAGLSEVFYSVGRALADEERVRYACVATASAASLLCAVTDEDYPAISLETYEGVGDIYAGLCNVYSNLSAKLSVGRKQELSDEISQAAISANAAMSKSGKPVGSALDDVQFFMGECINYLNNAQDDVIPVLLADTTQEEFAAIVEDIRFADSRLPAELIMGTEVYAAFREWAGGVKGATGDTLAGEAAVVANAHASPAYLLGAERLFENEPTVEIDELAVADGENAGTTAMTVAVTVRDGESAVAVNAAKVAAMFEATGDLGDWTGAAKLTPTVTTTGTDASGKMTFVVTPGDGTASKAFLRIRR